ncbi:MAG: integration host factor subunit beta [Alphaproteobacteria bacterium]|nr:integration host factor subunit beta [Alphaproteobacteria bacterium]
MTRFDLVKMINLHHNRFSVDLIDKVLDGIFIFFRQELAARNRIELRGFGVFYLRTCGAKKARNPKTGLTVLVPARQYVHFRMGKQLKDRMNQNPNEPCISESYI